MQFVTNRRCGRLGIAPIFGPAENPFPWMPEAMGLKREENFLETLVNKYQNGGALEWD